MSTSFLLSICGLFASTAHGEDVCDDAIRYRKSWFHLSTNERALFTEGYTLLRDNGKLDILSAAHSTDFVTRIHTSSLLLYYHSYLVYEMETAIRDLGGKFSCFAMPYYDLTQDHNFEENPKIFHSDIGENGDPNHNDCVANDWGLQHYTTPNLCAEDEIAPNCCLKRSKSLTQTLPSTDHALTGIKYADSEAFDNTIRPSHIAIHRFIGGHMACGHSMDDPIFPLVHSYMDLMRALWINCHGYDTIDTQTDTIPYAAYHAYCYDDAEDAFEEEGRKMCSRVEPFLRLDDELQFVAITDVNWTLVGKGEMITIRRLFNMEKAFNVKFDLNVIYSQYPMVKELCSESSDHENADDAVLHKQFELNSMDGSVANVFMFCVVLSLVMCCALCYKKQKEKYPLCVTSIADCEYVEI